jgi:GSH-dependent disulfide-bond oxidoreductase
MIEFYTANSSNGQRAAIMLEECGLPYTLRKLDLFANEQRKPEYLAINPAGAIPAIVDSDGPGGLPITVAQSGAILAYLAEKTGRFVPHDARKRAIATQWVFQATTDTAASSMMVFVISRFAPDKSDANVAFCEERTLRHLRVADAHLADREYLADELSIADFALYPLAVVRRPLIDRAGDLPNLVRWADAIGARPGVMRGMSAAA